MAVTAGYNYCIDDEDRICVISDSWREFARANEAGCLGQEDQVLGHKLLDWFADPETRLLYGCMIEKVRQFGQPITVPFRCDAPNLRRFMRLTISPAEDGKLAFTTEMVREVKRETQTLLKRDIKRTEEIINMCSWCKKLPVGGDRWLEVEDAVGELGLFESDAVPQISHTVCPAYFDSVMAELDAVVD